MTKAIFKRRGDHCHARASVVMSTQSKTIFEWTVKLISNSRCFRLGIASQLKRENKDIFDYDENAILYTSYHSGIVVGSNQIHRSTNLVHKPDDVVRFRFQPQTKKIIIHLVRT